MESTEPLLVLGATSLIGRHVLVRLRAEGRPFLAVSRKAGGPAEAVAADLTAPDLAAALPGIGAVLSLSPIWLLPGALPALKARGLRRLVAFSSTSVFGKAASSDPGERAVARRLAEAEAATRAFCEANGVAWTILRPTLIYDEGRDGNVSRLAGLIRRFGVLPLAGAGGGLRQPVHAEDLAVAALAALDRPGAAGRAYDLPGGETLTYRAMVERVFEGLGRRPRILSAPRGLWSLALALASPLLPGATRAMGERMDADLAFDAEPACRDLGWAPRPFRPRF